MSNDFAEWIDDTYCYDPERDNPELTRWLDDDKRHEHKADEEE